MHILTGCCLSILSTLPDQSVHTCVTSPPNWGLRDYGVPGQLGLEPTPEEYVANMVAVFREVRRVLRNDGTLWLNIGDSYASYRDGKATPDSTRGASTGTLVDKGLSKNRMASTFQGTGIKHKDLVGIPWMLAFAFRADGWYLRNDIIWSKPNPMPESVTDRPTKAHEYLFLLSKSANYHYDHEAIKEDSVTDHPSGNGFKRDARLSYKDSNGPRGNDQQWDDIGGKRNKRSVWTVATKPFSEAHFCYLPS